MSVGWDKRTTPVRVELTGTCVSQPSGVNHGKRAGPPDYAFHSKTAHLHQLSVNLLLFQRDASDQRERELQTERQLAVAAPWFTYPTMLVAEDGCWLALAYDARSLE